MNNTKIINLATPTNPSDAATMSYVDTAVQGLDIKASVHVATTGPQVLATDFEDGDTIDNHVINTGQRVLIKNQATGSQNGIYVVNATGAPTRASDLPATSSAAGVFVFVEQGDTNAESGWVCTNNTGSDIVGTDALTFAQFSGAGSIIAGTGLTKSGNTLSVNASQTQITAIGTITSGTWNGSTITVPYGGTGATTLTSTGVLLGNGTSAISAGSGITYASSTLTLPKITSNDSTSTTSSGTGAVLLSGGLAIASATDATSATNGGTITTAGGVAIAKKLFVGTDLFTGGNVGIAGASANGNLQFPSVNANRKIVLYEDVNNDHQYLGFGINSALLRYQVANTTSDHVFYAGLTSSTSAELLRVIGTGGIQTAFVRGGFGASDNLVLRSTSDSTKGSIVFDEVTGTTSSTTGAVKLSGGMGIALTTDATSSTNGGTITTAGGVAIAKKLFVGTNLTVSGVDITPSVGDIRETSFSSANNQVAAANVTGLAFANANVRAFVANVSVYINATGSLYALYELRGIQKASSWVMTSTYIGDNTNITFSITTGGQIQYTSGNEAGFVSGTIKFRAQTTTV